MTTTTINDLFSRYADACGSEGPVLDRDALQDDFRDWCRARGVDARYEVQGESYLAADDGAHSDAALSDDARDVVMSAKRFFVVPAPGRYGDKAKVYSSHRTLEAARKAAGETGVVRLGDMTKGDAWLRAYESTYPLAK